RGNFIGADPSGTQAVPNNNRGVSIEGSSGNTVGGVAPADANLISGNVSTGVRIDGSTAPAAQNRVLGNVIGLAFDESHDPEFSPPGNNASGVRILDSSDNQVDGNVIAANAGTGVFIDSDPDSPLQSRNNVVRGNLIGTNAFSDSLLGNRLGGVFVTN